MRTANVDAEQAGVDMEFAAVTGSHRRTLQAIFRHPLAHNLEWRDVVALIGTIGTVQAEPDDTFVFTLAGHRHVMHKPHHKDLATDAVLEVRPFLMQSGLSAALPPDADPADGIARRRPGR